MLHLPDWEPRANERSLRLGPFGALLLPPYVDDRILVIPYCMQIADASQAVIT